ncbi:MAG: hypothetical protein Q8O67_13640 [Deltaproteobacteria bacterium]|nr:hypothetical protein [Deltaproteobacteria bacterium]
MAFLTPGSEVVDVETPGAIASLCGISVGRLCVRGKQPRRAGLQQKVDVDGVAGP